MMTSSNHTWWVETVRQCPRPGLPRVRVYLPVSVCSTGSWISGLGRVSFLPSVFIRKARFMQWKPTAHTVFPYGTSFLTRTVWVAGVACRGAAEGTAVGKAVLQVVTQDTTVCCGRGRRGRGITQGPFLPQTRTFNITSTYYSRQELQCDLVQLHGN